MAPSPPTYTSLSGNSSSSSHKNQAVFITLIVAPYALLSLLIPTTASLPRLLPFLFFSSVIHLYTHPYLISRLFPSILPDSPEGQRKLWTGGNWQLACLLTLAGGLVGARINTLSEGELICIWLFLGVGGSAAFIAWNSGTQRSSPSVSSQLIYLKRSFDTEGNGSISCLNVWLVSHSIELREAGTSRRGSTNLAYPLALRDFGEGGKDVNGCWPCA
jgi:hypothetical protein